MEKKLINEINRVSELMDIKPLILEQPIPKFIKGLLNISDEIIKSTPKKVGNEVDNAIKTLKNADNIADQKVIDDAVNVIIKNVDFMDGLAKLLIKKKMLGSSWDDNIERIVELINKNQSKKSEILAKLDDAIDKISFLQDAPNELFVAIKKQVRKNINSKLSNLSKKLKLTPGEIEQFIKVVESKTVKTFAGDIRKYWKQDVDVIKNDIIAYSEGFLEEIKNLKKNKKEIQLLINAYSVQISRLLDRAEIKMNGAAAKILEEAGVDKNLVNKITFGKEPFFVTYQKLRGKDNQKLYEIMSETSKEFLVEVKDLIRGLFRKEGNTIISAFNPKTSVGQWFYTNQWASLNKLYRLAIKMSPGESRTKLLKYILATMFASSIGFVFGTLLKGGLLGLMQLYGGGLLNKILSFVGGDDRSFLGKDVKYWKVELPPTSTFTEYFGEIGKPLDAIGAIIYADVYEGFKKNGFKDVFLRMAPGGLLTYPESLAVKLFESLTPGEGYVPNFRDKLLSMVGMSPKEVDAELEELENNINTPTETATVEGAKEVADEQIKDSIWGDENGNIFLAAEGGARYRITFENNVYMVEFPNNKKKLSEL